MEQTTTTTPTIDPAFDVNGAQPAPERPRFRLTRSRTDRMLGGVCGGIAESFGIDATLVRIGLVALTLLGVGSGAIVYVAIWALAPEADVAEADVAA
ncbi:PspC domain-containing protein [Pseudonocardia sp. GCM10023141]|uniref:PspC domain-containing protein n=1 Tax=Pseudonocardia sp. GCM10023141 TaxID=3252653 RepID=UPI00361BFFA5